MTCHTHGCHTVQTAHAWRRSVRPVPTPPRWVVVAGALLVLWAMFWKIG